MGELGVRVVERVARLTFGGKSVRDCVCFKNHYPGLLGRLCGWAGEGDTDL